MKIKMLWLAVAFIATAFTSPLPSIQSVELLRTQTEVYLCMGPGSKKYHFDPNCRGLNRCSTPLKRVSLTEAKRMGRGLCGWED